MTSRLILASSIILLIALSASAANNNMTFVSNYLSKYVRTRTAWKASDSEKTLSEDNWKDCFAIHHTAGVDKSSDDTVKEIQTYHMKTKKWADIGYHYLVGSDGKIFEGRELRYQGAHVTNHNKGAIGVNFLGCYDTAACSGKKSPAVAAVTDAMIDAMGKLIGVLSLRYNINLSNSTVKGHREFPDASTVCPGDLIMEKMPEIREIAQTARTKAEKAVAAGKSHHEEL